jgi:hypothetical protein
MTREHKLPDDLAKAVSSGEQVGRILDGLSIVVEEFNGLDQAALVRLSRLASADLDLMREQTTRCRSGLMIAQAGAIAIRMFIAHNCPPDKLTRALQSIAETLTTDKAEIETID